jgi:hypothetical protein
LGAHDRQVGQAVPTQRDGDRQVEHDLARIMTSPTGPPGASCALNAQSRSLTAAVCASSEPPAEEINDSLRATT